MSNQPEYHKKYNLEDVALPRSDAFVDGPFGSNLKTSDYTQKGVRLIQLQNIGEGIWVDNSKKFTSLDKLAQLKRHAAKPGDIAIAKMAEPVARACIIPAVAEQFIVVADCIKLSVDAVRFDANYIVYLMNTSEFRFQAERKSTGTTRLRINLSKLRTLEIQAPDIQSQRAIAAILRTVDDVIRQTGALIEKLRRVKAGMLHDLLTCGLDENGELRDPIRHPEQFKDSPQGKIPSKWRADSLRSVVPVAEYGISSPLSSLGYIPVVRMNNLIGGRFDISDLKYVDILSQPNLFLRAKDILFNRTNSMEHVGRTSIWNEELPCATFASYLVRLVPHQGKMFPDYLVLWMNRPETQIEIRKFATTGVQQVNINPTNLSKTPIAYPNSLGEQKEISQRISALVRLEQSVNQTFQKLQHLKQGLMQDLLTGRVRVTNLQEMCA